MKKFSAFYLPALIVTLLVVAASCKKDDDKSKTELLTGKTWTLTKYEYGASGYYAEYPVDDCEKDDTHAFTTALAYTFKAGANTDCGEEDETGTWAWKDGEKVLSITVGTSVDDATLEGLSDGTLKLKHTDGGIDFISTYTGK